MNTPSLKDQMTNALHWAGSGSNLIYASLAVGLLVALILFRLFFKNLAGFVHCIGFSLSSQPNAVVAPKPGQSRWNRVKLLVGTLLPAGSGYAAYLLLPRWFPAFFQ
ncbi:MAG TPA: hypothetical protein VNZ64_18355 [Candidatus Acidoferrum sp.]|jgi:hypothetical protein|nr:hypothetical protein [Candidatus Acidoferrum sp.]